MSSIWRPRLSTLLMNNRPLLDEALGEGAYEVEDISADQATVKAPSLICDFAIAAREGSLLNMITYCGKDWQWLDGSYQWSKWLIDEAIALPCAKRGDVKHLLEQELVAELELLARLVECVFANPEIARDASLFLRGYRRAYNDFCSGSWEAR